MISVGEEKGLEFEGMSTSSISTTVIVDSFSGLFLCFLVARGLSSSTTSSTSIGDALWLCKDGGSTGSYRGLRRDGIGVGGGESVDLEDVAPSPRFNSSGGGRERLLP